MKIFAAKQTLAAIRIDAYNSERSQRGTWEFQQKNSTSWIFGKIVSENSSNNVAYLRRWFSSHEQSLLQAHVRSISNNIQIYA